MNLLRNLQSVRQNKHTKRAGACSYCADVMLSINSAICFQTPELWLSTSYYFPTFPTVITSCSSCAKGKLTPSARNKKRDQEDQTMKALDFFFCHLDIKLKDNTRHSHSGSRTTKSNTILVQHFSRLKHSESSQCWVSREARKTERGYAGFW